MGDEKYYLNSFRSSVCYLVLSRVEAGMDSNLVSLYFLVAFSYIAAV